MRHRSCDEFIDRGNLLSKRRMAQDVRHHDSRRLYKPRFSLISFTTTIHSNNGSSQTWIHRARLWGADYCWYYQVPQLDWRFLGQSYSRMFYSLYQKALQAVLFSHPGDFTPVCTTELGEVARRAEDFAKRNVKVIGISANGLEDHHAWVKDINDYGGKVGPTDVQFPIVSHTTITLVIVSLWVVYRLLILTVKYRPCTTCWITKMPLTVMQRVYPSLWTYLCCLISHCTDICAGTDRLRYWSKESHPSHDLLPCLHWS